LGFELLGGQTAYPSWPNKSPTKSHVRFADNPSTEGILSFFVYSAGVFQVENPTSQHACESLPTIICFHPSDGGFSSAKFSMKVTWLGALSALWASEGMSASTIHGFELRRHLRKS